MLKLHRGVLPPLVYKCITTTHSVVVMAKEASFCSRTPSMFLQCLIEGGKGKNIYVYVYFYFCCKCCIEYLYL